MVDEEVRARTIFRGREGSRRLDGIRDLLSGTNRLVRIKDIGVLMHGECPVCFLDVPLVAFRCNHAMCASCLTRMLERDGRCCICRTTLVGCTPSVTHDTRCTICIQGSKNASDLFGMRFDPHLRVASLRRGAVAKRRGVRVGDRLVGVNGLPCPDRHVTERIVRACDTCRLTFERAPRKPFRAWPRVRRSMHRLRVLMDRVRV